MRARDLAPIDALAYALAVLAPGTLIGRDFRIIRPLASGGMGAVYVARQESTGRERALKVMLGELASNDDLRRRFAQEATIGARIQSEHVVEVVAAGIDDSSGAPWLAMELLSGRDLSTELREVGALSAPATLHLFEQICHAAGQAHAQGIVHRDLKPENVFLASRSSVSGGATVKILDFGIAKLVSQARTQATAAMGTPLWMAPEQMQTGSVVSPATDVWALGLIAFRVLAGVPYWKTARDANASAMMLIKEVGFEPLVPASERSRGLGGRPLPAAFDAWFARCVAREPQSRFRDASELMTALKAALGADPQRAVGSGTVALGPMAEPAPAATIAQHLGPTGAGVHAQTPTALGVGAPHMAVPASIATPAKRARPVPFIIIGALVAVAVAIGVVVQASRSGGAGQAPLTPETGGSRSAGAPPEKQGTTLAPAPSLVPAPSARADGAALWVSSIDEALKTAADSKRPLLVHFRAEWCAACKELESKTLNDPQFLNEAKKFVLVKVDLTEDEDDNPKNKAIRDRWKVNGLPVILILNQQGEERVRITTFTQADNLVAAMSVVER